MRTIHLFFGATALALMTVASDARAITLPDYGNCNSPQPCLYVQNSNSIGGGLGGYSSAGGRGVTGSSSAGWGVYGVSSSSIGVYAQSSNGLGLYAVSVTSDAIYGESSSLVGVGGRSNGSGYNARGVNGVADDGYGVQGTSARGTGVAGSGGIYGVYGGSTGTGIGVVGENANASGWAGYFNGKVHVNGTLSKASGTFVIDHPLDRANKVLRHSFVESPDAKNIYDGVATMDKKGEATVSLPPYFEALNKNFRYQLTNIGAFAQTYIASEIKENKFKIAGGRPGTKVSWQVTCVRHDAYMEDNPIVVEEEKNPSERGKFLHARKGEKPTGASR
jgi:hypothetical protein